MNKKNSEYLTIGEVSKLKNVSIKSLHYYDDIGVFKPNYINPDTGYRYYLVEQLPILNIISFCTEVGISLKNWGNYLDEKNNFALDKLLVDAKQLATQKLNAIQTGLAHIERTANKMNTLKPNENEKNPYTKVIPERNLLFIEVESAPKPKDFLGYLSKLFHLINEMKLDVTSYYPAGVFTDFTKEYEKQYVFIEIDETLSPHPNYRKIESGTYLCFQHDGAKIYAHREVYPEYFNKFSSGTIIETDLINHTLRYDHPILELQYLI